MSAGAVEPARRPLVALLRERPIQVAVVLALLLRLWIAASPGLPHYGHDGPLYLAMGLNVFEHATFAATCDPKCVPSLLRTPGYPIFLGFIVGFLRLPWFAVLFAQATFGAATTLLVAAMGYAAGGRRVGVAAAFVHGLDPFDAAYAGQMLTESLTTLVLATAVYGLWWMVASDRDCRALAWVGLGSLLGLASLIRPVAALLPVALAIATLGSTRRRGSGAWREHARRWAWTGAGFAVLVAPWVLRNAIVSRDGGADGPFEVLAVRSMPYIARLTTPGVERWYGTFEEPFVWDREFEAPSRATYFLPGERERVERLFTQIRAENGAVTPEIDAAFERLAEERASAHPLRTTVVATLSRAARLWVTPRLSAFGVEAGRLSSAGAKALLVAAAAYNATLAGAALAAGIAFARKIGCRLLLAVPAYLTAVHAVIMWGRQSRYVVPGLCEVSVLAAWGGVAAWKSWKSRRVARGGPVNEPHGTAASNRSGL